MSEGMPRLLLGSMYLKHKPLHSIAKELQCYWESWLLDLTPLKYARASGTPLPITVDNRQLLSYQALQVNLGVLSSPDVSFFIPYVQWTLLSCPSLPPSRRPCIFIAYHDSIGQSLASAFAILGILWWAKIVKPIFTFCDQSNSWVKIASSFIP